MNQKEFQKVYDISAAGQKKINGIMEYISSECPKFMIEQIRFLIEKLVESERTDAALQYHEEVLKSFRNP